MDTKELHKWFIQNRDSIKVVGEILDQNGRIPFGIMQESRRQNLWILGVTGTGKSQTMKKMALEDIRKGRPVIYLDPYGSVIESLVPEIASEFGHKLYYLNAGDIKNVLDIPTKDQIKDMIRAKQILLVDFEINKIGEDKMQMYGEVVLERVFAAVQEQFSSRKDVYIFLDELQLFQKRSIVDMITQSETLFFNLVLSHQKLEQLKPEVLAALEKHANNLMFFRTTEDDRKWISENLDNQVADKISELGSYEFVLSTKYEEDKPVIAKAKALEDLEATRSAEHQSD